MSRITASAEVSTDDLEGADAAPWPKFIEQYNELARQVVANINQSGPLLDCPTSRQITLDMVHAASVTVKNPLSVPIKSIVAVSCVGLSVDSTGKPTRGVYNLGCPALEWHNSPKADGSVVITPTYPAPGGALRLTKSVNQSVASGALVAAAWDVESFVSAGQLTHSTTTNNSRITCSADGLVRLDMVLAWGALAAALGNRFGVMAVKNGVSTGAGSRFGQQRQQATGNGDLCCGSCMVPVVSGDYLEVFATQTNGAASALDILGAAANEASVDAAYSGPAYNALGRVGLLFIGSN